MKRSEMIEYMFDQITQDLTNQAFTRESHQKYWKRKMTDMLAMIEGFGMMPPPIEEYQVTTLTGEKLGILNDCYEWEPENEKV